MPQRTRKAVQPTAEEQLAERLSKQLEELLAESKSNKEELIELQKLVNRLWIKVM